MKKISIIVPCHNAADWIGQGWDSLKNQTIGIENLECIFVDDASDDDGRTWEELQRIERECPESVMVIRLDENVRQGGARNVGMQYMTGKYMLLMDADDLYRPEACRELYGLAEEHNTDIIQFDHDVIWRDMNNASIPPRTEENNVSVIEINDEARRRILTGEVVTFGCTNKLYSTDLIKKADTRFAQGVIYEEPLFVYPLFLYVQKIALIDTKYYIWRKHEGSTMTSELGIHLMDHPGVQYELMQDVKRRADLYNKYREEIDFHFFFSFFYETMCFAVSNKGGNMVIEQCNLIKQMLYEQCPDINNNKYFEIYPRYKTIIDDLRDRTNTVEEWRNLEQKICDI